MLAGSIGPKDRTNQPSWAPSDLAIEIQPIPQEMRVQAAKPTNGTTIGGYRGDFDNVHLKVRTHASDYLVSFPNCNWPFIYTTGGDKPKIEDLLPCLHLHESWLGKEPAPDQTYSKGQDVLWNILRRRAPGPEESPSAPSIDAPLSILNSETLYPPRQELVLWVESLGQATQCDVPAAGDTSDKVNNSQRPCRVFPNGIFFTPRR